MSVRAVSEISIWIGVLSKPYGSPHCGGQGQEQSVKGLNRTKRQKKFELALPDCLETVTLIFSCPSCSQFSSLQSRTGKCTTVPSSQSAPVLTLHLTDGSLHNHRNCLIINHIHTYRHVHICIHIYVVLLVKNYACQCMRLKRCGFDPRDESIPGEGYGNRSSILA